MLHKWTTWIIFATVFGSGIFVSPSDSDAGYRRRCARAAYRCHQGHRAACRRAARRCGYYGRGYGRGAYGYRGWHYY